MNLPYSSRQFSNNGYCIVNLLSKTQIEKIKKTVINKIKKLSNKSKYLKNFDYKKMHNYHLLNVSVKKHKN